MFCITYNGNGAKLSIDSCFPHSLQRQNLLEPWLQLPKRKVGVTAFIVLKDELILALCCVLY
jgi:hypothetical protein